MLCAPEREGKLPELLSTPPGERRAAEVTEHYRTSVRVNNRPMYRLKWRDGAGREGQSMWHRSSTLDDYPVGSEVRRRLAQVSSLAELDDVLGAVDPSAEIVEGGERIKRGHTNGPIKVALPDGYLDDPDELVIPDDSRVMALSGG